MTGKGLTESPGRTGPDPGSDRCREYGSSGPRLVLLHGGPGAFGYLAPVARELSTRFRVLEPRQRPSGAEPLTVERHVADLDALMEWIERVAAPGAGARPALVGHSWGAMLALAYAARHPGRVSSLVLVGCGTFDRASRRLVVRVRDKRTSPDLRRRLDAARAEICDPDERLAAVGRLLATVDSYDPAAASPEPMECDARAHRESWQDMIRLQESGVYPAFFEAVREPVLMLHGAADPHPGRRIRASLRPHLRSFEYRELERCGHYPWLEPAARGEFYAHLISWLSRRAGPSSGTRDA